MEIEVSGCEGVDWSNVVQGRDRGIWNTEINLRVTLNAANSLISWAFGLQHEGELTLTFATCL
jgi:hypothetical protein